MGRSRDLADGTLAELNVDSNTLAVDATNDRVGIGTSSPSTPLTVHSDGGGNAVRLLGRFDGYAFLTYRNSSDTTTNGEIGISDAQNMQFYTGTTERMRIDSSGNLLFNSGYGSVATAYGCRAWVNFNGTGTVAIRASGNVSSITDNGTGHYTVNFTTAMPDANYAFSAGAGDNSNTFGGQSGAYSTTAFQFYVRNVSNTPTDEEYVSVIFVR